MGIYVPEEVYIVPFIPTCLQFYTKTISQLQCAHWEINGLVVIKRFLMGKRKEHFIEVGQYLWTMQK